MNRIKLRHKVHVEGYQQHIMRRPFIFSVALLPIVIAILIGVVHRREAADTMLSKNEQKLMAKAPASNPSSSLCATYCVGPTSWKDQGDAWQASYGLQDKVGVPLGEVAFVESNKGLGVRFSFDPTVPKATAIEMVNDITTRLAGSKESERISETMTTYWGKSYKEPVSSRKIEPGYTLMMAEGSVAIMPR